MLDDVVDLGVDDQADSLITEPRHLVDRLPDGGKLIVHDGGKSGSQRPGAEHDRGRALPDDIELGRNRAAQKGPEFEQALDPAGVEDLDQALRRNARLQEDEFVEAIAELIGARLAGRDPFLEGRHFQVPRIFGGEDDPEGALVARPPARADLGDEVRNDRVGPVAGFLGDLLDALPHLGTNARVIAQGEGNGGGGNSGDFGQGANRRHISHGTSIGTNSGSGQLLIRKSIRPGLRGKTKGRTGNSRAAFEKIGRSRGSLGRRFS